MNPRGTLINEQELLEGKNHVKLHHSYIFFLYQLGMTTIFATTPLQKNKQKKETVQSVAEHTCSTPTPKKKKKAEWCLWACGFVGEKKPEWCLWRCGSVEKNNSVMFVNMWFCGNKKTEWCLWTCGFVEKKEQSDVCEHSCGCSRKRKIKKRVMFVDMHVCGVDPIQKKEKKNCVFCKLQRTAKEWKLLKISN